MILNVSGRTDIIAFYSKWFLNRYEIGFFDVRNPFNPKLVNRIYFEDVDAIMFCTKNPLPIVNDIEKIKKPILFQVTITPYKNEIEPNVPSKKNIIEAIKKISSIIGKENMAVRYDPIFLSPTYTLEYHLKAFEKLCKLLNGYVKKIIISFIDEYKNVQNNKNILKVIPFKEEDYKKIGLHFSKVSKENNLIVHTCFEKENLVQYGFSRDECVSLELAYKLTGKKYKTWKSRGCGCAEMVDIGAYNTCNHFCKYCYANYDESKVLENVKNHDDNETLLIGHLKEDDQIKIRRK